MAKTGYVKTYVTGGTAGASLEGIDGNLLLQDDFCWVGEDNIARLYFMFASDGGAASPPDRVVPLTNPGTKMWILQNLLSSGFTGSSATSNAIGTGSKTFTIETNKGFVIGMSVKIADSAAPGTNWMHGDVTAYTASTGELIVTIGTTNGSGTKTAWTVSLSAPQASITFSRGGTIVNTIDFISAINTVVWRAPYACTVTNVRGYRVGGTGATINARLNGTDNHLASALSLVNAATWYDGGAVQNTTYVAGDTLEIMVVSVAGNITQIAVQVDFIKS